MYRLSLALCFFCSLAWSEPDKNPKENPTPEQKINEQNCTSAKEYITTYNFLKSAKEYQINEINIREVALKVSKGCTGAAQRFVHSFEVLMKARAGTHTALSLASALANMSDNHNVAFIYIFTRSFLKEFMDMDFVTSIQLARSLSTDYKGDVTIALSDFKELTQFCANSESLSLSKPQCAQLAARIAKYSESNQTPIAASFIKAYNYFRTKENLQMPIQQAVKMAERIIKISPYAIENFIVAHDFASEQKDGLNLPTKQALLFAFDQAKFSLPSTTDNSIDRLPAQNIEKPEVEKKTADSTPTKKSKKKKSSKKSDKKKSNKEKSDEEKKEKPIDEELKNKDTDQVKPEAESDTEKLSNDSPNLESSEDADLNDLKELEKEP